MPIHGWMDKPLIPEMFAPPSYSTRPPVIDPNYKPPTPDTLIHVTKPFVYEESPQVGIPQKKLDPQTVKELIMAMGSMSPNFSGAGMRGTGMATSRQPGGAFTGGGAISGSGQQSQMPPSNNGMYYSGLNRSGAGQGVANGPDGPGGTFDSHFGAAIYADPSPQGTQPGFMPQGASTGAGINNPMPPNGGLWNNQGSPPGPPVGPGMSGGGAIYNPQGTQPFYGQPQGGSGFIGGAQGPGYMGGQNPQGAGMHGMMPQGQSIPQNSSNVPPGAMASGYAMPGQPTGIGAGGDTGAPIYPQSQPQQPPQGGGFGPNGAMGGQSTGLKQSNNSDPRFLGPPIQIQPQQSGQQPQGGSDPRNIAQNILLGGSSPWQNQGAPPGPPIQGPQGQGSPWNPAIARDGGSGGFMGQNYPWPQSPFINQTGYPTQTPNGYPINY